MNELIKRKPCRLKGYDYSLPGAYFVTICVKDRKHLLGKINVGEGLAPPENRLTVYGNIAKEQIELLESRYSAIKIDRYVVMPNHIHLLISIDATAAGASPCPTISDVVCVFKSITTRLCKKIGFKEKIISVFLSRPYCPWGGGLYKNCRVHRTECALLGKRLLLRIKKSASIGCGFFINTEVFLQLLLR